MGTPLMLLPTADRSVPKERRRRRKGASTEALELVARAIYWVRFGNIISKSPCRQ